MIDWTRIEGFERDGGNSQKSARKHRVDSAEAEQVFFNDPLLVRADERHSAYEARYHALGFSNDGRLLHITFILRADGTLIRVISARDMNRKERALYEQEA